MAYQRKTHDEWEIHSDYGNGFEFTVNAENAIDAKRLLREYRVNQPQYRHKIVKRRRSNNTK